MTHTTPAGDTTEGITIQAVGLTGVVHGVNPAVLELLQEPKGIQGAARVSAGDEGKNMLRNQRILTEKALFDYYMASSSRENEVYSPFPFYIDKDILTLMVESAEALDHLVGRIISRMVENPQLMMSFEMDDFAHKSCVINSKAPLLPFFWVRYDAFQREDGGIFFSEFNYDKPCAQREIVINEIFNTYNDPNTSFRARFLEGFENILELHFKEKKNPVVAILVEPGHYDELHLAYLYIDLLKPLGLEFVIAGQDNLTVRNDRVFAFEKAVDVILRQYPTEFLSEVNDFEEILRLFNSGKVLIVNDPRAIIGQAKSLYAYLWRMVLENDPFLTPEEIEFIKRTIPFTEMFNREQLPLLGSNKDKYVIKAVYGRYSEEVYIGCMHSDSEWDETLSYVADSDKLHIVQEFCPIKKERVLMVSDGRFTEEIAHGNIGIYLANGSFAGTCVRWSPDYLSQDYNIWISPIGVSKRLLRTADFAGSDRERLWKDINDEAAFGYGYTGGYTGMQESFSLEALVLDQGLLSELEEATNDICSIFKKTTGLVQDNHRIFCPVLGISDNLSELVKCELTDSLSFVGRFDWVLDTKGDLKLLEFNSETPAGLMEGLVLSRIIKNRLEIDLTNPNEQLKNLISDSFSKIVYDFTKHNAVSNIGFVSTPYYEDWYNTAILMEQIRHLPYNIMHGEVSGMEAKEGKVFLYGTPLDAVYRYYPLDWFENDGYYAGIIDAFKNKTSSINPPATLISQSKAFLALVWELRNQGFYNTDESNIINKYIPETSLAPGKLHTRDYCAKPCFGREGQEIRFSIFDGKLKDDKSDSVFQERIDIQSIEMDVCTTMGKKRCIMFPVIGAFVTGDRFAGIYTRAGNRVTDRNAIFLPTFIKD